MTDAAAQAARLAEKKLTSKIEVADAAAPDLSEEALAQRFVRLHGDGLCFVAKWSQWYAWTGPRWETDSTLDAFDRACAVCRSAAPEADTPNIQKSLASAKTVAAVEKLAKADRRIAATVDQWDVDPDVFNTEIIGDTEA